MIDAGSKKVGRGTLRMFAKALLKVLTVLAAANATAIPDASDLPWTPGISPGPDWHWKGKPRVGEGMTNEGNWINDKTGQQLNPDLQHADPKGPHWELRQPDKTRWDIFPDGRVEQKGK